MLQALRGRPGGQRRVNSVVPFPAPFGGWNARDDITDMPPEDAILLDNFIPGDGSVALRNGYAEHADGLGGVVRSLMEHSAPDGSGTLFAAVTDTIFDVTTQGEAVSSVTGLNGGNWSHTMFATAGGNFLVCCNGADSVRYYDGSSWTVPTINLVTSSTLDFVMSHQSRLWFIQEDTLKVWYLDTLSVAGDATAIDFGGLSKLGGKLVAMASWTRDSGDGIEDLAVFITSKGEVHVYSGSDPDSAATWSRVGTFRIAEPVGRRCVIKVGGDVGILTTQGLLPLSGVLGQAQSAQGRVAITDKIRNAYNVAYKQASTADGWQIQEYPLGKLLMVNIPIVDESEYHQYVMNVQGGGWCRFTGMEAFCWSLFGEELYFGGVDGSVWKYTGNIDGRGLDDGLSGSIAEDILGEPETGFFLDFTSDELLILQDYTAPRTGTDIEAKLVSAFSTLKSQNVKYPRRIQPRFFGPTGYRPQVGLRFDYEETERLSEASIYSTAGTAWDEGSWDTSDWSPPDAANTKWQSIGGTGTAISVVVRVSSQEPISYHGSKLEVEAGDHI
jgi:hypothetical protein